MELAKTLLKMWSLRFWLAIGAVLAIGAALASMTLMHSKVYASASTQMIVDAPQTALGDAEEDLTPYTARAFVFARLMTTPQSLQYIGQAAGLPGNLIAASGPTELTGPQATHAPTATAGIQLTAPPVHYSLNFLQNPQLPTVDIYSQAPTTKQAIALANGAVRGFAAYIEYLDNQSAVPAGKRIAIRQLGAATGGVVDPGAKKSVALIIFVLVFGLWTVGALRISSLRSHIRLARTQRTHASPNGGSPAPAGGILNGSSGAESATMMNLSEDSEQEFARYESGEPASDDPDDSRRLVAWDGF
jgi:hypothetical protein